MQTQQIQAELRDFIQFAASQVESGNTRSSIEELVQQWRQPSEFARAVADVRQGMADDAQGKSLPISEAFSDIRKKLGSGF